MLTILGRVGSLWAADPIIGTWKLDIAKSKFPPTDTVPKEVTDVYKEVAGDRIELTRTGTEADGAPISSKWTWPRGGGMVERKFPKPLPKEILYIESLIERGHWYVTVLEDGKQIGLMHKVIAKDGKTMRITTRSLNEQGKLEEELSEFERQ